MYPRRSNVAALVFLIFASSAGAQASLPIADKDLLRLTHSIVTDSLVGGGQRIDQSFFSADSSSARLLALINVPAARSQPGNSVTCPGSTNISGGPVSSGVGYRVKVQFFSTEDSIAWLLKLTKSCLFIYQGEEPRGFYEGGSWEIRKVDGVWRIVRMLDRVIT
jgi:hypothetical protein